MREKYEEKLLQTLMLCGQEPFQRKLIRSSEKEKK